jgi:glucokinase
MPYAIGIDLGGTNIKYGLADHLGNILYESIRPTYMPDLSVYDNIAAIISGLKAFAGTIGLTPAGIGIGAPALIDNGKLTGCFTNLPELEGMALGVLMEEQSGIPVFVGNDANLMGLAEWKFGAARGATDAIFLTIGTGVGGAIVANGEMYTGYLNRGAELGHIIIEAHGNPCGCGGRGCLEAQASVKALIADYKALADQTGDITGNTIVSQYLNNQQPALQAMNRHFDYLGVGIAGLINIFSPQLIIIGGGISEAGDFYINAIRDRAMQRAMKETSLNTVIKAAQLGNKAGFLGAAALVFNNPASTP